MSANRKEPSAGNGRQRTALNGGDVLTMAVQMAEGNPGAASVIGLLLQSDPADGFMLLLDMDDMNIRGCQIWIGYKDHCKQDIEAFKTALRNRDPALIETVNRIGAPQIGERAVTHGASFHR